ncbi:cellular tumor antigen p53-like isoform X3 [Eriocheir sinensis]|uniref:cellular tumor antigen p53-like isoform X3 n=1 Tax=Eriocheir sinensis TaxID=95602 RepID=UPI0021C61009|nr:cellular tumor antigen p53-like isoform X3 [Eriocheir sinensis]
MDLMVCGDPGCGGWLPHSLLQPLTAVPQEPDTICFTPAQTLPLTSSSCFILRISDVEPAVPPPPPPPPGEPLTATRRKEAGPVKPVRPARLPGQDGVQPCTELLGWPVPQVGGDKVKPSMTATA